MPRQKKKTKLPLTTSFDETEESLLLGDDTPTPTRSGRASRRRSGPSLDAQEEELLGESPIVIKKSTKRRRKTRSSNDQTPQSSTDDPLADTTSAVAKAAEVFPEPGDTSIVVPDELDISVEAPITKEDPVTPTVEEITAEISAGEPVKETEEIDIYGDLSANQIIEEKSEEPIQPVVSDISIPHIMSDISIDIRDIIPPITPLVTEKTAKKAESPVEEIDIYGDLSANTSPTTAAVPATNGAKGKEISFDEVFKMSEPEAEVKSSAKRVQRYPSEKEEEDLDYEEEAEPQMKIGVLVSKKQLPLETATPDHGHILPALPEAPPAVPQPPVPQQQMIPPMLIPPMLPLPPMSGHALRPLNFPNTDHRPLQFPPPHYKPISTPSFPRNNSKRKIYINPKFKTQVILSNLEKDGVLKGGVATIHVNSRHISPEEKKSRARSRSPICHGVPEYIPSPIRKTLDEPTTTLIVTELSACTTRNRLKEMFASIGTLKEVQTYPQERRAVVTFAHAKDAVVCRRKFHRSFIDGTYMSVNFAI